MILLIAIAALAMALWALIRTTLISYLDQDIEQLTALCEQLHATQVQLNEQVKTLDSNQMTMAKQLPGVRYTIKEMNATDTKCL